MGDTGHHSQINKISLAGLVITLGIIYGDIGTSPLYVMKAIVHTREDVILLVAHLTRTNILLRWIRFLLLVLIIILCYKFFN